MFKFQRGGLKMRKKNITIVLTAIFLVVILATSATAFNPIYKILSFFNIGISPAITAGNVYPVKVSPGDVLLLNITVKDVYGIDSVTAKVFHESGYDLVTLGSIESNDNGVIYQGTWICHNAKNLEWYDVIVEVTNVKGKSSFITLKYLDPTQNHPASEVTAGTFDAGDFTFQGNLTVNANVTAAYFIGDGSQLTNIDAIPTGVITMWSGSVATIPSGWALCNGSNGTPDLRDLFIVGAGLTYNPDDTGGSLNTSDYVEETGSYLMPNPTGYSYHHHHTFIPPYYALAYIMKL